MSGKTYNVGVIGYGLSAKIFHIPLFTAVPSFKLYAIVQRSPKPDDDAEKDFPGVKGYRSADELFKDSSVDVVVVTTTPVTHYDFTKQALESGKHVVVEKPFVPTEKEARELADLSKKTGKLIAVYQNRRWDSDYVTLSNVLKSNELGRVAEFETHFDRHRPSKDVSGSWKAKPAPGGGVVYDLGTHLMDQVVHSFGMPKRLTGFVSRQKEGNTNDTEDSCTILLHYEDGMMATVKAGVVSPEQEQLRYWIRGTKGSFKKFHLDVQEDQLKGGLRPSDKAFGVEPETHHATVTTVGEGGKISSKVLPTVTPPTYTAYYELLAKSLDGSGQVPVSAEEAANVIRLVELAHKSSAEGKTLNV